MNITKTKHIKKILLIVMILVGGGLFSVQTYANGYQSQINGLQTQIDQYRAEADRIGQQANTLQNALDKLTAEKNAIQAQISLNEQKQAKLQQDIAANQVKLERQKATMSKTVAQIYANGTTTPIEMLASSKNVGEYIAAQGIRNAVRGQMKATMDEVKQLKTQLETQEKEVQTILAEQKTNRDVLAGKESEQAQLVAATRSEEAAYQNMVASLEQQKAAAEAALARSLNTGSYKVSPVGPVAAGDVVGSVGNSGLSTGPHLHLELRRSGGGLEDPGRFANDNPPINMPPGFVSQSYGNRDPFYARGYHPGTDYAASTGAPIFSIAGGYLYRGCSNEMLGTTNNEYGYVSIVEHSDGTRSVYAHQSGGPGQCNYNTYY